jgi:hypothetical protein
VAEFSRDFTTEDQFSSREWLGSTDPKSTGYNPPFPSCAASVVVAITDDVDGGLFRRNVTRTEFIRVGVPCPNCRTARCSELSRSTIKAGAA